jgi:hypothetical protein
MSGTWKPLSNQPAFGASTMLLLTDGTVMCQEAGGVKWWRLTPDIHGSYVNGTWSALAPMHHPRLYYASAVLRDGRVLVSGGEYSDVSETKTTEIYNPLTDVWTEIPPPAGWNNVGDAPSCVLPDGRFLLGNIFDTRTAIYDPIAGTWTAGPAKNDASSEETWTLLGDETVVAAQCSNHPNAEKYVAAANAWVPAGTIPVDLVEAASIEVGPAFLLPDGRVFAIGATNHTAIYTPPPIASQPGTWAAGPDFANDPMGQKVGAKDAPGCLMPNGRVLCVGGPVDGVSNHYLSPTYFYEFDGVSLTRVTDPPNSGSVPFVGRMLLVPTGEVLFANGSNQIYAYTPSGAPDPAWRPHITSAPASVRPFHSYTLHGRQLNGLSQAVGYGDDASAATNYPIVKIRNLASGHVRYVRTFDHSTMGVATGFSIQSTTFSVPFGTPVGPSQVTVIANGIESQPMFLQVLPFTWPWQFHEVILEAQRLFGSLADGPLWVLGPHGPIPVDPMAKLVDEGAVRGAWKQLHNAFTTLQTLGAHAAEKRIAIADRVQPAVDPELAELDEIKASGKQKLSLHSRPQPSPGA